MSHYKEQENVYYNYNKFRNLLKDGWNLAVENPLWDLANARVRSYRLAIYNSVLSSHWLKILQINKCKSKDSIFYIVLNV